MYVCVVEEVFVELKSPSPNSQEYFHPEPACDEVNVTAEFTTG